MKDEGLGRDDGTFSEQRRILGEDRIFHLGDRVEKRRGYRFPGIVTAIDETADDGGRYVVTATHPDFAGMKHIFSAGQLRLQSAGETAGRRFRHIKRGSEYVALGNAELQTSHPIEEGTVLRIYADADGHLWARPVAEFEDGRFQEIDT